MTNCFPNILLITGTGRNIGKTTLACRLIESVSKSFRVTGMKVTHHHDGFHGLLIQEETDLLGRKDTSSMLRAGAERSFYCQTDQDSSGLLIPFLEKLATEGTPLIIESGALHTILKPGLLVLVSHSDPSLVKPSSVPVFSMADLILYSRESQLTIPSEQICFGKGGWYLCSNGQPVP
jgi:hypothetical protein